MPSGSETGHASRLAVAIDQAGNDDPTSLLGAQTGKLLRRLEAGCESGELFRRGFAVGNGNDVALRLTIRKQQQSLAFHTAKDRPGNRIRSKSRAPGELTRGHRGCTGDGRRMTQRHRPAGVAGVVQPEPLPQSDPVRIKPVHIGLQREFLPVPFPQIGATHLVGRALAIQKPGKSHHHLQGKIIGPGEKSGSWERLEGRRHG